MEKTQKNKTFTKRRRLFILLESFIEVKDLEKRNETFYTAENEKWK